MINRLLLIVCVCIVVVLILYFFYWNRFIAFLIGKAIRVLFWNQEGPSIWIEIGSIHFSLLAGRILLKDVRYHSSNQTVKIVKGQIQWRYWIRRPTSEEEISPARGENFKHPGRLWSCRIQLTFEGMEWFLYNRTAAYDGILEQFEKASRPTSRSSSHHRLFRRFSRQGDSSPFYPPSLVRTSIRIPEFMKKAAVWVKSQLPTLDPKELLPLGIDIRTGAIILGNPSTPSLLVAEFQNASGTFGIVPSRSKYDLYKQVINLKFHKSTVRFVHNDDYVDPMTTLGAVVHGRIKHHSTLRKPNFYQPYRTFVKIWRQMKLYSLVNDYLTTRHVQRRTQPLRFFAPYTKFKKNADEDTPVGIDFSTFEYAIERKILEAPVLELTYYVDVVGEVPSQATAAQHADDGVYHIRNGDTAPEWGFDVIIYGGIIRYGPWADRQRTELQRAFFPPTYLDSSVTATLKSGEKRMWEALQVFVELRDETTLHIPFREASKDWQWDGVVDIPQRPRTREAASIIVDVGDRSSISYVMPMVVGPSGYESTLEVHLDSVSITSSLNDIRIISAESCRVRCELPSPIRWDAERTWSFAVFLRQPVLFILRDHVNMFTDLAKDWVSGPPTEYQKFIPMIYSLKLEMHHFELNLYANDQNIVDKPLIKEENALVVLKGPHLKTTAMIPSNQFRPESTSMPFTVAAPDLLVDFLLPRWNTHALHARKEGIRLFRTSRINGTGSYRYFSEVADEHMEQLKLQFDFEKVVYWGYGWSIRYLMVLRDNYLGSFTHFQTLSEYLDKRKQERPVGDPIGLKYRPGKSNMLQVEVSLRAEGSTIMLPIDLIGDAAQKLTGPIPKIQTAEDSHCISLTIPEIQLQFRMHDYYMEMSLNIDTITGSIPHAQSHIHQRSVHKRSFMIDGLDITANRLFGPQPRTATYVCIWEIAVGNVKASMSANDVRLLAAASNTFRLNFVDLVNSPADDFLPDIDPDVTFYKVTVKKIEAVWKAGHAALFLQMSQRLNFDSNDLGAHQYRKVMTLRVPEIRACVLLTTSTEKNTWLEALEVFFDVHMDIYSSPIGHRAMTRKQLAFIEEQDRLTGRAKLMFNQLRQRTKANNLSDHVFHRNGVFLPQPSLPNNITSGVTATGPPHRLSVPLGRPPSWRASTLANLSDSDEEGISEADRDARLARTRTSTPAPEAGGDDVTMSTGDESDDADLTDGGSTGDNWSDVEVTGNEKATGSLMTFYSPIVRHYEANWLDHFGSLEGAPFTVTRDKAPFMQNNSGNDDNPSVPNAASEPFPLPDGMPRDENVTTYRIKLRKAVEIFYSPLLLSAITHFEEDIERVNLTHEVLVDSLLVDCLENAKTSRSKCQVIDLDLPALTIQLIQHIPISEERSPDVHKPMESVILPHSLDVTAIFKLAFHTVHLVGIYWGQHKPPTVRASINRGTIVLGVSIDKKTLGSSLSDPTIADMNLSSSSLDTTQRNLRANLGALDIRVGNRGPEIITTTLAALASTAVLLSKQVEGIKLRQIATARNRIGSLLQASEQWPVIDSLSTIQPSYLVQSGIPHVLRTDTTFKFLYHLRNSIWNLNDTDHDHLPQIPGPIALSDFLILVESRLSLLDQDTPDVANLVSMKSLLFEEQATKHSQEENYPFDTLSLHARTVTVTVVAPTGRMSTQFIVNNLGLDVQSKSFDLIQFSFPNVSSASQTSLRSRISKVVRKMVFLLSVDDISLVISPHLMHFAQHVLRVKRQFKSTPNNVWTSKTNRGSLDKYSSSLRSFEIISSIHRLRIQAAAENLTLVMGLRKLQMSSTLLAANKRTIQSMNLGVLFDEIYFQARSTSDPAKESDQDILAALTFTTGRISAISRPENEAMRNIKFIFTLAGMRLHVPRSALRLYHFVGEWRADYLPGMEAAIKTLLSEYNAGPVKPHSSAASRISGRGPIFQIHGQITHFEISLQVMHGTWLSWEVNKTVAYIQSSSPKKADGPYAFGLQIASMVISVSSKPNARDVAPSSRVKLMLPSISVAGHSDGYDVHTLILFEFIELKVKPSHWDTLLSVQQKFGQDFNDLVALMQKTRQKGTPATNNTKPQKMTFQYEAHLKMQGFRIGLEGVGSTVLLECQDIDGGISNSKGWAWDIELSNLALSLAPRARGRRDTTFNRDQRSAFVIIDFKVNGSGSDVDKEKTLELSVSKMHAVLQPSSIGELGDFIDNLQAEMLERQEQRVLELATFKEKTQSILKTFDVNLGDVQSEKTSWINHSIVNISIQSVGFAFPLIHDDELVLHAKDKESTPVRAFLFSIKSIQFGTHRGESGQATMQHLSFQFVSRFKQSIPEDFAADKHHTRNRLLYPKMTAQLRSSRSGTATRFWIKADVNGFIFDIDSTIPKYIFSLIDVYRQGKERVDRLSTAVPRTPFSATPMTEVSKPPPLEKHYTAIPTSNIFASLTFHSGKVRLYSGSASNQFKNKILSSARPLEFSDDQILELGAEVFKLPIVSVWTEYRATPASQKLSRGPDIEPSVLIFNSTVHSSNNTLRPILLPFLTELVSHVENRMRKVSFRTSRPPSVLLPLQSNGSQSKIEQDEVSFSSLQICFSLRIDKSKLELTCQPDVNVVAGLHWESGGFVINVSPGARKISFFGSVGGLTIGLKHGFLSEDCVKLDARDLAFSVSFQKLESGLGHSISLVLDTEFLGGARFSRLQDILCFKAVWLDRIPIFNNQSPVPVENKTPTSLRPTYDETLDPSVQGKVSTMVLVRIRKIKLEIDLGQSISKINLELDDSVLRTNLADDLNEVFVFIGDVSLNAQGNLSGHARVSSCVFQTIRRSESSLWNDLGRGKMLELRLTSGALVVSLQSDHQELLQYRAQPLEVEIFDDWSRSYPRAEDNSRPLQLSFTVSCPEIIAAVTVGAIPKLLSYANKFKANLDTQRQGAFRESQTFRATRTPKPDNPLSAVAEAMLHSARSRFKEADSGLSYIIRQHMSLRLDLLQLIVFPRTMRDAEVAQFIGRQVEARLDGLIGTDLTPGKRDLRLSFSSMVISRYTQVSHPPSALLNAPKEQDGSEWPKGLFRDATEAIIVGLPSMKMHMISEEVTDELGKTLIYDFYSQFVRRVGMKAFEDIYITLNMSLYSWLTVLRKNLTRELDQVRATEDWRTSMSNVSTAIVAGGSQRKKKPPDPLSLTDSPRSATLPSAGTVGLSPFAPSSARHGWPDQHRSPQSSREQSLLSSSPSQPLSSPLQFPVGKETPDEALVLQSATKRTAVTYKPRDRHIERLTMRQLGEATPDVMHPFFMKKAGFNLEDSLPQYVNEYAIVPLEEIMEVLLKLYSQQLLSGAKKVRRSDQS